MIYALCLPAPPPREPDDQLPLFSLLKLLNDGDQSRYQRMINAAERLYPLEYRPPMERQSRFRPAFV